MKLPTSVQRPILYLLIFLSGAAGLIYQVVWHRYLAILLGAQARATTVVLAIFLGGISLGYLVFGRWTRWKRWNLLLVYALVEVALGFWAFLFPAFFRGAMAIMPQLYAVLGLESIVIDFLFSILLVGVPTFLMGGTLPLLTQGLSEDLAQASQTHARIYGFNTLGACFGCLLAGYLLIPATDLPFTVTFGGVLNVLVALTVYFLFARGREPQDVTVKPGQLEKDSRITPEQIALLAVGVLSGFYIIALETVLIRLMGLSTGASNYNFTLIVAIFILGLGIGSLLVRNIGSYKTSRLFWNQVAVAVGLLLVYVSGDHWSYWVHVLRARLRDIPENFFFFQFLLGLGFTALLVVPVGVCGLTLPLCFHLIKDRKESLGQRVGQLYGLNTIGSVLGAFLGGYYLLNFVNLDHLFKICVFLSVLGVGFAGFVHWRLSAPPRWEMGTAGAITLVTLIGLFMAPLYHRERNIQPFRHPEPIEPTFKGAAAFGEFLSRHTKLIHWDDDPNTSLGVGSTVYKGREISRTVFVNGKSDGNTRGDLFTTIMLAHIPALLSDELTDSCVIGFGTGVTIGTYAQYAETRNIDVVEISRAILKNVHYYDPYNGNVSRSEKVRFHEMDAFRFLGGGTRQYDVIISEPSNPWVMGIENLYSAEFYKIARSRLKRTGTLVQWIHTYSFTNDLFRMVLKTMGTHFPYVSVFQLKGGDLALVGRIEPFNQSNLRKAEARLAQKEIAEALKEHGFTRLESILALEVVPGPVARVIADTGDIHRLESPKLSDGAARAFFTGESARIQDMRREHKEFYPSLEYSLLSMKLGDRPLDLATLDEFRKVFCEMSQSKMRYLCEETMVMARLVKPDFDPNHIYKQIIPERELAAMGTLNRPVERDFALENLQEINAAFGVYKRYASPIARIPVTELLNRTDFCLRTTAYGNELYGECLLQKILVLETATLPGSSGLNSAIQQYLEWFPSLPKDSRNYEKLLEARKILERMIALSRRAEGP